MTLAAIPSPTTAVWELGPLPLRAYALCIIAGIVVACVVTEIRLRQRGAPPNAVLDIAIWAVPFGIIGARLYHVITSPQAYFGEGGDPIRALYVWEPGLGIWGAVAGGVFGAWLACRQLRLPFVVVLDAGAVGLPLAQALGRIGNWFNNELYGGPTDLPWGLRVWQMSNFRAQTDDAGDPVPLNGAEDVFYHPTFLYEALWNVALALVIWHLSKRLELGRGRAFALYVAGYTAGRFWIELLRADEANEILGLRVNTWVSGLLFIAALIYFFRVRGPAEYLIPVGEDKPGYRVVGREEFQAYQADGGRREAQTDIPSEASEEPEPDGPVAPTDKAESAGDAAREPRE